MDLLVNKMVTYCISNHFVDNEKEKWLRYGFEMRLSSLLVMIPFFALACALSDLPCAISFFTSFYCLKRFTSGYHAKSPYVCLFASLIIELFYLCFFCPLMDFGNVILTDILCAIGIFLMAPYNHPNMNLSQEECAALRSASRWAVALLSIGSILSFTIGLTQVAVGITTGISMATMLLSLAYILDRRKTK